MYDTDILAWSEEQAELLRLRAANLDWDNLAEEIGDVGLSLLYAVESHVRLGLLHDLKAEAWPLSRNVPHWRAKARLHRDEAHSRYSPSMAQRTDVAKLYRQARRGMPDTIDETRPLPVPERCPAVTLAELLAEEIEERDDSPTNIGFPPRGAGTLYESDILAWAEEQAELLRRRAANDLDWDNLAEEIKDVGLSLLHAVESHLRLALLHDLKAEAWPLSRDVPHWRAEARLHRDEARSRYSPSMAQRIDVAKLYRQARRGMPDTIDETRPLPMPASCPVTLAEILAEEP